MSADSEKARFIRFSLLIFSIFVTVVGLELYLSFSGYPYQNCEKISKAAEFYLGQYDQLTGWSYKENFSYFDQSGKFEYHFDKNGFRSFQQNASDSGKPKLLFVGDSVTFGEGLNFADTFPMQINKLLGDKYEVVNLGVQGFGTIQTMLRAEKFIEKIKPQFVVYTFIPDHIDRNINYDRRLHFKCLEFAGTKPIFDLSKSGQLVQVKKPEQYDRIDSFKLPLFLNLNFQHFVEKSLKENGQDREITKKAIERVSEISTNASAQSLFIFYDNVYKDASDSANQLLLNELFKNQNNVLPFINWATDSQLPGTKYYVSDDDDFHPNASLSAEVARRFVEKFGGLLAN